MIDHEDLDRVAAEALVDAGVGGVVNAAASISGRYPNLGPLILAEAGVPLDRHRRAAAHGQGAGGRPAAPRRRPDLRPATGSSPSGCGRAADSILHAMDAAKDALGDRFESFARNTLEYMHEERDLLFGGAGLPELDHDLDGRPVLVVVRGYDYREDLAALRGYIRDVRPVLVGVDGGADALLDEGYRPDLIVGDMDSVSDRALAAGAAARRHPTELIVHAYPDGRAPGRERLEAPRRAVEGREGRRHERGPRVPAGARAASGADRRGRLARQPARVPRQGSRRACPARSWSGCAWGRS